MTTFRIVLSEEADEQLTLLEQRKSQKAQLKAVRKTLGLMETNLRHPSLNTHEFTSLKGPDGEKVFESYAQNKTPGAYRIFWYYGARPKKGFLTIATIVPHP
jgi:hypothetical protein